MTFRDVRTLTDAQRWYAADRARVAFDVPLPDLAEWNYSPCAAHAATGIARGCRFCGMVFRRHQRTGVAWLYLAMRGLLADGCGLGKTAQVAGVLAMMKEAGELGTDDFAGQRRAVIVAKAAAVGQWAEELARLTPRLRVVTATETQQKRAIRYMDPWDVMVISYQMLSSRRNSDQEWLEQFRLAIVVADDVDPMGNPESVTSWAVKRLCTMAPRAIIVHATPLQKRVMQLWSFLEVVGGREILGPADACMRRYVRKNVQTIYTHSADGREVQRTRKTEVGVKNGAEFRARIAPLILRRTHRDVDDVDMPDIQPNVVWLDPTPAQRRRYEELRRGVLRKIREDGESVSRPTAMAHFMHGWQICSGLAALDNPEGAGEARHDSVKLDWAADRIDGDLSEDKVVVFINFKPNVADMCRRLDELGIGYTVIWGNETNQVERQRRLRRFRDDPACRVLLGTTSIEQSLNLQVARHLIAVDTIINPARMTQLAGRIQRDGSAHETVYLHQLLLRGTQEEHIMEILRREQAVADYVWGDRSEIFQALSPLQLMHLITGDPALVAAAGRRIA